MAGVHDDVVSAWFLEGEGPLETGISDRTRSKPELCERNMTSVDVVNHEVKRCVEIVVRGTFRQNEVRSAA